MIARGASANISHSGSIPTNWVVSCTKSLQPQLAQLAGASVLVTGATGWFGAWLLDALCAADEMLGLSLQVTAVSRNPGNSSHGFPVPAA